MPEKPPNILHLNNCIKLPRNGASFDQAWFLCTCIWIFDLAGKLGIEGKAKNQSKTLWHSCLSTKLQTKLDMISKETILPIFRLYVQSWNFHFLIFLLNFEFFLFVWDKFWDFSALRCPWVYDLTAMIIIWGMLQYKVVFSLFSGISQSAYRGFDWVMKSQSEFDWVWYHIMGIQNKHESNWNINIIRVFIFRICISSGLPSVSSSSAVIRQQWYLYTVSYSSGAPATVT